MISVVPQSWEENSQKANVRPWQGPAGIYKSQFVRRLPPSTSSMSARPALLFCLSRPSRARKISKRNKLDTRSTGVPSTLPYIFQLCQRSKCEPVAGRPTILCESLQCDAGRSQTPCTFLPSPRPATYPPTTVGTCFFSQSFSFTLTVSLYLINLPPHPHVVSQTPSFRLFTFTSTKSIPHSRNLQTC